MNVKNEVREFYDQVGWQEVAAGQYQNARYEDLRPVSQEYIQRCHLRLLRHIRPQGRFFLDAGSGPVQYPEYLQYSRHYQHRVCADISIVALQEARRRLGEHGLYVVADIANLPFKTGAFEGVVSLHTIHHLPLDEHSRAYTELYRMLAEGASGVVVNGWDRPPLMNLSDGLANLVDRLRGRKPGGKESVQSASGDEAPSGTFVRKHNAAWLKADIGRLMPVKIWVWRSVNTRFLRTFIHDRLAGRLLLRFLFWLEERFPHYFGSNGQYPLIVISKPGVRAGL